jgi:hypothetical protein
VVEAAIEAKLDKAKLLDYDGDFNGNLQVVSED